VTARSADSNLTTSCSRLSTYARLYSAPLGRFTVEPPELGGRHHGRRVEQGLAGVLGGAEGAKPRRVQSVGLRSP
jgi:hypothetical protein